MRICTYIWPHFPRTKTFQLSLCPRLFPAHPILTPAHRLPPQSHCVCECALQVCSALSTICFFHSADPRSVYVGVAIAFAFCFFIRLCTCMYTQTFTAFSNKLAPNDDAFHHSHTHLHAERHSSVRLTIRVASLRVLRERIVHSVYINISKDTCSIPRKLVAKKTNVGKFVGKAHTTRAHAVVCVYSYMYYIYRAHSTQNTHGNSHENPTSFNAWWFECTRLAFIFHRYPMCAVYALYVGTLCMCIVFRTHEVRVFVDADGGN